MKNFYKFLFRILFIANIVCLSILIFLLVQLVFPGTVGNDIFAHFIHIGWTVKILSFWGATNIVIVLLYSLIYKPQELYKDIVLVWIFIFSLTYFVVGYLLFKESYLSLFM